MNTPIYDAMRRELRQRNKTRLFHLAYGANIPDSERPLSTDYDWPFSDDYRPDRMLLKDMLSPSSYESLKTLTQILGRSNESWHYVHRSPHTMPRAVDVSRETFTSTKTPNMGPRIP